MERIPKPGEFYRHFKNKLYQIIAVAEYTETGEKLVVYQALYGDFRTYAQPLSMFMYKADTEKYSQAEQEYGFERVEFLPRENEAGKITEQEGSRQSPSEQDEEEDFFDSEDDNDFEELDLEEPFAEYSDEDYDEKEKTSAQWLECFLDAQGYEKQLEVLAQMRGKVGKSELDSICLVLGIPMLSGDEESQLSTIIKHLETRMRYDSQRLRQGRWKS